MIYFARAGSGPIKIGHSISAKRRIKSMQPSNAEKLILIATIPGDYRQEKLIHKKFSHLSIGGEWFEPGQDLLDFIKENNEPAEDIGNRRHSLVPTTEKAFKIIGENIKLARLRRKLTSSMVAERAGITRPTLRKIEAGNPWVSFGTYAMVLFVLGLEGDVIAIAANDPLGRKLQDIALLNKHKK